MKNIKELFLTNSLSRKKEPFVPIDKSNVRLYVCGPTVYDDAHIGNARPVVLFDILARLLRYLYGQNHVIYVRNITDVDDKINQRAHDKNISISELTKLTTQQFHKDSAALGCQPPTIEPRATQHIEAMKALIEKLIEKNHAYSAENHVLFDVSSMESYGELSNRSVEDMIAGSRVEVAPYKKSPMDFVLWKPSKEGEPSWSSPANIEQKGRPGWHIECSAMAAKHLGQTFDLHGGGIDLMFPHHENEIAQSRAAFETEKLANYWVHNGFVQVDGQKMSKSEGNFITMKQLLETSDFGGQKWSGDVIRLCLLKTHYRQPLNFTINALKEAEANIKKWRKAVDNMNISETAKELVLDDQLLSALCDDLNGWEVFQRLNEMANNINKDMKKAQEFIDNARFLGFFQDVCADKKQTMITKDEVEALIKERLSHLEAKQWAQADKIRDDLNKKGILLKDLKDKETAKRTTQWSFA